MTTAQEGSTLAQKNIEMQPAAPVEPAAQPAADGSSSDATANKPAPPGFIVHRESSTSILFAVSSPASTSAPVGPDMPTSAPVFLNPVQEYNRDLSVVAIRSWSEIWNREKTQKWEEGIRRKREKKRSAPGEGGKGKGKKKKGEEGAAEVKEAAGEKKEDVPPAAEGSETTNATSESSTSASSAPTPLPNPPTYRFTLLEALSATGLRAIRYAKELPLLKHVIANDLSAGAVEDIKRNIEFNGLAPKGLGSLPGWEEERERMVREKGWKEGEEVKSVKWTKAAVEEARDGKVRVNQGDACVFMYQHRAESARFDVVDLDPYGSAVPFLDAAVNSVADGGLMCITCTDMGVLAGHNYPEKAYSAYGGLCVNAEYSHEVGLRLVLHALAQTAARYGRYIEPQLSLSIDFYVRLFVRVRTGPKEVKGVAAKTSLVYYCHSCQSPHFQPLGRVNDKPSAKNPIVVNTTYHVPSGPPEGTTVREGGRCGECGGKFTVGGPMWSAPIHNPTFISEMLSHISTPEHTQEFKTAERIKGMLTVAQSECEADAKNDAWFYFSPAKMASLFNAVCPPISTYGSALLNAGYSLSRSHASAGSLKTNAPRKFVHDVIREWVKAHPVKVENVKEGSPAKVLLAGEQTHQVSLAPHPQVAKHLLDNVKLVRYQTNPTANWGPARAAVRGAPTKQ
ncbi:hypothetical protein JCM8547_008947 [Rhodosporidiobolus lusitaniae]